MGYLPVYKKFIDDKNKISSNKILRNNFYLIKEYNYANGDKERFDANKAPIIYTIFVSKVKDIVHCVKVSDIRPDVAKKFFGKFYNEEEAELEIKGRSSAFYEKNVKKFPNITSENYRTYNLSGLTSVFLLNINVENLTQKNNQINKVEKIKPKAKIEPKSKVAPIKKK